MPLNLWGRAGTEADHEREWKRSVVLERVARATGDDESLGSA